MLSPYNMNKIPLILVLIILTSCGASSVKPKLITTQKQDATIAVKQTTAGKSDTIRTSRSFDGGYGFVIGYAQGGKNDSTTVVIKYKNKLVFAERTDNYYIFDDTLNPVVLSFGNGVFEVFLELDNSPNKATLKGIKFHNDTLAGIFEFPTFIAKPCHLFGDKRLGVAGRWDFSEIWTDSNKNALITFDPFMYYVMTADGLLLDTAETVKQNKRIFGVSDPFNIKDDIAIPDKRSRLIKNEFKRIENCK